MNTIGNLIIRFRKWIVGIFIILLAVMGFCALQVHINYNMMDYLPEDANSTKAIQIMEDNFSEGIANANVMIPNVTLMEALDMKKTLLEIDGVKDVMWLDDTIDLRVPLAVQDLDTIETYYKDGNALFTVTIEDGKEKSAVNAIYELVGKDGAVSGNAVSQATSQKMAVSTSAKSIIVLGVLIILVLLITTTSWLEPVLYLSTIGIAVIINLGLTIVSGEMSFVTLSVSPILQLAVSLDYAVFLSHSFEANRGKTNDVNLAMKWALKDSFQSIFGSAATTLFGFVALMFMAFKIGPDMGVSLVRGVIISYLSVMLFLPALILSLYKIVDKTKHKSFIPDFKSAGKGLLKVRVIVLILIAVLAIPTYLAQKNNVFLYGTGEASEGSRLGQDEQKIKDVFDENNMLVMLVPVGDSTKEMQLSNDLKELTFVKSITSYTTLISNKIPKQYLSDDITSNFYSENYARIIISTSLGTEGETAFNGIEKIRSIAAKYYPDNVYLCGETANMYDMMKTVQKDNALVNNITLIAIFLVLLLQFRSLLIPVLLISTIKIAVWINMSIPYFTGGSLSYIGYLVVSTVMMGATIDYAILLTDHYMIERREKVAYAAMRDTISGCIKSMLVSSSIMTIAGFSLGLLSDEAMVQVLGTLLGRGAIIAFVLSLTLLPGIILLFDKLLPYLSLGLKFYKGKVEKKESVDESFDLTSIHSERE